MQQPQSFYPTSPKKQFDRVTVTETHTHTDKLYSNFDHIHDDVTSQGINRYQKASNLPSQEAREKTLSKVRSMPHTQFNQLRDEELREPVTIETPSDLRRFANNINAGVQNREFGNISPVANRVKPSDAYLTMNTNVDSRQVLGQETTPTHPPKLIQQRSTQVLRPQQRFEGIGQPPVPMVNPIRVQRESIVQPINIQHGFQPPRVSVASNSFNSQNLIGDNQQYRVSNVINRSSMVVDNRQSLINQYGTVPAVDSRNVLKSHETLADTRLQYQSVLIDQQGNQFVNPPAGTRLKQKKFSFISGPPAISTIQEYQEVQMPRPEYQKIYNDKGVYYRTVGPQHDYFKEEKSCLSKLLPILGYLSLFLLITGTLVGIGVLTGLIGGKNYLSGAQSQSRSKSEVSSLINTNGGVIVNQIQNGITDQKANQPIDNVVAFDGNDAKTNQTVAVTQPESQVQEDNKNVSVVQPIIPIVQPIIPVAQPVTPVFQPIVPIAPAMPINTASLDGGVNVNETLIENKSNQFENIPPVQPVQVSVNKSQVSPSAASVYTTQPEFFIQPAAPEQYSTNVQAVAGGSSASEAKVEQVSYVESVQTVIVKQNVTKPETINKPLPTQPFTEKPVETAKPQFTAQVTPITQPQSIEPITNQPVIPVSPKVADIEPVKPVEQSSIKPTISQPQNTQQPIIQPVQPIPPSETLPTITPQTNPEPAPTTQPLVPATPKQQSLVQQVAPLSDEEAQKVINTIIEQNNDIIPVNYKASLKSDILNQFETVPLNFKTSHHLQTLALKHIQEVSQSGQSHRVSSLRKGHKNHRLNQLRKN